MSAQIISKAKGEVHQIYAYQSVIVEDDFHLELLFLIDTHLTVRDYLCRVLSILDTISIHGIAVHLVHVLVLAIHAHAVGVILSEYFLILVCNGFDIRIVGCLVHVILRQVDLIRLVFKDAT